MDAMPQATDSLWQLVSHSVQISGAVGLFAGQILSLAALEAAVAFGVASAVMLVYRRSTFGRPPATAASAFPGGAPPS